MFSSNLNREPSSIAYNIPPFSTTNPLVILQSVSSIIED